MPKVRNRTTGLIHDVPAGHPSLPPQIRERAAQVVVNQQVVNDTLAVDDFYLEYDLITDEGPQPKATK